jgi:hypothetical protein
MPSYLPEILIVQYTNGTACANPPAGYAVQPAPRRAARGRSGEVLFTALALQARTPLPAAEADRLAGLMGQVFFETPGSVTAALRAAFTAASAEVLPFGQSSSVIGAPAAGMAQLHAVCAILRDGDLYLGFGGNVLALIMGESGVQAFPAPGDSPARALGTTLNIDLRYGHAVLGAGAALILAAAPPPAWTESIPSGLANLSLRAISERLAQQSASRAENSGALLVRFSAEEAPAKSAPALKRISLFPSRKPQPAEAPAQSTAHPGLFSRRPAGNKIESKPPVKSTGSTPPEKADPTPATAFDRPIQTRSARAIPPRGDWEPDAEQSSAAQPASAFATRRAGSAAEPTPARDPGAASPPPLSAEIRARRTAVPLPPEQKSAAGPRLSARDAAGAFGRSFRITVSSALESARAFLAGILPRGVLQENDRFSLPPAVLLGTAIAIPLVIIAVVAVMYFRKGYELEFSRLMDEARTEASVADAQTDPLQARAAWQKVFDLLATAAKYGSSDELMTLQSHSARMLDNLDGITPLDFKTAIAGGLEEDSQITALIAGDRELYALDGIHDRILRLVLGQGGYQLDETFSCRAGEYPDITVESLVDMVWVPGLAVGSQSPSSPRSGAIVSVDRKGTVLYCPPGGQSMAGTLTAPYTGWATPASLDYYNGRLYVLDPENNGFWRYDLSDTSGFDQPPTAYFTGSHPSLADAVDFVVASGEVFFLHADGGVSRCQYDPLFEPADGDTAGGTLCEQLLYNDTRPGRSAGPHIADALLDRIYYNDPPEPTLFFLDPLGRGAYRFSLALNFISRYRVTIAPTGHEATALAVGADKVLYIAIGNQIYFAQTRTP